MKEWFQNAAAWVTFYWSEFYKGGPSFAQQQYLNAPGQWSWVLAMCGVLAAYLVLFVLVPMMVWSEHLKDRPLYLRFCFALITQTFFEVNVVLLLALLKVSSGGSLWAVTLLYWALIRGYPQRKKLLRGLRNRLSVFRRVLMGRYGVKLLLRNEIPPLARAARKKLGVFFAHLLRHCLEYLVLGAMLAANLWYYSYGVLHFNTFGAGDLYTHVSWIYNLGQNNPFSSGIYPFAMHCKVYALHALFGIGLREVMLYFGLAEIVMLLLGLYCLLRTTLRRRCAALLGVLFASFPMYGPGSALIRFQCSLPEECAAYLLFPIAMCLIRWLRDTAPICVEKGVKPIQFTRLFWNRRVFNDDLILFAMSVSLVVGTHLYAAIAAVFVCIFICVVYMDRLFWRNLLFPLMMAVAAGAAATVFPFAIAIMQGKPFEGSIIWALSVMGTDATGYFPAWLYALLGAAVTVLLVTGTLLCWLWARLHPVRDRKKEIWYQCGASLLGVPLFFGSVALCLYFVNHEMPRPLRIIWSSMPNSNLFGDMRGSIFQLFVVLLLLGFALDFLCGKSVRGRMNAALWLSFASMTICFNLTSLGLPQLMNQTRATVFAFVLSPMILAAVFDHLLAPPVPWVFPTVAQKLAARRRARREAEQKKGIRRRPSCASRVAAAFRELLLKNQKQLHALHYMVGSVLSAGICAGMAILLYLAGEFHGTLMMEFTQSNSAAECARSIMANYPDWEWTIVSPTDELYQVNEHGFHEELIEMVDTLDRKNYYTLPSEYVFFFVEKQAIGYQQWIDYSNLETAVKKTPISYELAMEEFVMRTTQPISNYKGDRAKVMSKMYYWAQAFMRRYPNEMKVYYEDTDFVCYVLHQNTYSLYNLDVDYGFVMPQKG